MHVFLCSRDVTCLLFLSCNIANYNKVKHVDYLLFDNYAWFKKSKHLSGLRMHMNFEYIKSWKNVTTMIRNKEEQNESSTIIANNNTKFDSNIQIKVCLAEGTF